MRTPFVVVAVALVAVGLAGPAPAAAEPCEGASCGTPDCWEPNVRLRPGMTRMVTVSCRNTSSAKLVTPPAHSDVSNVSADWYGLHFDGRPHAGAPRWDEAVFELTGYDGSTVNLRVRIEVVPRSENSPPICEGDRKSERSDGSRPVDLFMHPYCRDPDGDDFVMEGGPPGVHLESPKKVPAGSSESNWPYRTATHSGDEVSKVWATDSLGARSNEASLEVTVGPGVDRLPVCRPNPYSSDEVLAINTRPGKIRRFGVICEDADADLFVAAISSPPERGALAMVPGPPSYGFWGVEIWQDSTYVPAEDDEESLEPDPFSVTARGDRGAGPVGRMAMVPREESYNSGGGCGWSGVQVFNPGAGVLQGWCDDNEGDELTAEVIAGPRHGTITGPVLTPALHGSTTISVPYVPDAGYEGYDCVELRISDGHGTVFKIAIDIWVKPLPPDPPPEVELPELPELPHLPPLPDVRSLPTTNDGFAATPGPGAPVTPVTPGAGESPREAAERVLATKAVKQLQGAGGAQVFARSRLSRRSLLEHGEAPAVVVVCPKRCQVRGDSELAIAARTLRSSRRKTAAAVAGGQPHVLTLALGAVEQRALRRARRPQARFRLSIRPDGGRPTSLSRSIPISR